MKENPYNEILSIMQGVAGNNKRPLIAIGKVLAPPPNIQISYNGFILEKEEIYISEYLLVGYERTAKGVINSATQNRGGGGGYAEFASHNHDIANPYTDNIIYTDTLKPGELVSLAPIQTSESDKQQYLILDKIVHL